MAGTLDGDGQSAAEQQNAAAEDGTEYLIVAQIGHSLCGILRVKMIEPWSETRAEHRIDSCSQKLQQAKPYDPLAGVCDQQGHQVGSNNNHEVIVNFRPGQKPFPLLNPFQHHGRENGKAVGQRADEGNDANAYQTDLVHAQKAGIENAGDEHVVKAGQQRADKGNGSPLALFIHPAVDQAQLRPDRMERIWHTESPRS